LIVIHYSLPPNRNECYNLCERSEIGLQEIYRLFADLGVMLFYYFVKRHSYSKSDFTHWLCPSVRLIVCLSPKCVHKNAIFSRSNLQLLMSHDLICKESIIGLLTFKTAEIRHLENRQTAISQRKNNPILMKFGKQMQIQKSVTVT